VPLWDGSFELRNCDPDRTYRVSFLDARSLAGRGPGLAGARPQPLVIMAGSSRGHDLFSPAEGRLGTVVELSAKKAGGKPVTVKLSPCGSAKARFLDGQGKPVRPRLFLELLVRPGPSLKRAVEQKVLTAEVAGLVTPRDLEGRDTPLKFDDQGRVTIPVLIPGATYRMKLYSDFRAGNELLAEKDFTVASGKTLDLGDVVIKSK
jgi:hypothetical protein